MKNKNNTGSLVNSLILKKKEKPINAELSPLLISSIQNTYKKRLESSSIDTLIDYNLQQKEIDKETKKVFEYRTQAVLNISNKIVVIKRVFYFKKFGNKTEKLLSKFCL